MYATVGCCRVTGCALMVALNDAKEVHVPSFTVKVYVFAARPLNTPVVPVPVIVADPGDAVTVQAPAGNPLNATLPVGTAQVGCVMVPMMGAVGVAGCALITALIDAGEVHPAAFVTVKVYVFAARPLKTPVVPVPVIVADPGDAVTVQAPAGKPLNTTLPVANAQVGCVIVPMMGAVGVTGCALMVALNDATEVHPVPLFTVKVYVFAARPLNTPVVPVPVMVADPGDAVTVQAPAGKPLRAILPVDTVQVGCVMVPMMGAVGVTGCALMVALNDAKEVHVPSFTVKVYVFAARPLNTPVVPVPVIVADPGNAVTVQVPAGNPLNATLPVAVAQVGCVIVPMMGAVGVAGCALISALADAGEVHPAAFCYCKSICVRCQASEHSCRSCTCDGCHSRRCSYCPGSFWHKPLGGILFVIILWLC